MFITRLSLAFRLGRRSVSSATQSKIKSKSSPPTPDRILSSGGSLHKLLQPAPDAPKLSSHQAVYKASADAGTSRNVYIELHSYKVLTFQLPSNYFFYFQYSVLKVDAFSIAHWFAWI
jgi:hypothetical protein